MSLHQSQNTFQLHTMDHLNHLICETKGLHIDTIKKFYKDEYKCKVKHDVDYRLFCPVYDHIRTDFGKLGALATRGTVFVLNDDGIFDGEVACLPFFKFFNADEKHAHQAIDEDIVEIQRKADGSLIKVFHHNDEWVVATNGTPVASPEFKQLFEETIGLTVDQFDMVLDKNKTYLFELCTPQNKIVVAYDKPHAKMLLARCKHTHKEFPPEASLPHFDRIETVQTFDPTETGQEGVVVVYKGGHRVKQKTAWYKSLHKTMSKSFDGYNWDAVVSAIHGGFYDDVLAMIPDKHRQRAENYMRNLAEFDDYVESLIAPYKLEKHEDKEKLVQDLKDGFFERAIEQEWLRGIVLNVLFGKYQDLYSNINKGHKGKKMKEFIEMYKK